jgi:hypothetical protein
MNIEVNATLIIQIINFFIAYFLFRFILLKPAYAAIQEDEEVKQSLEQLIEDDKRAIETRRQTIADQWQASHTFFKKYTPKPVDTVALYKEVMPKIQLREKPLDQKTVQLMKDRISQAIIQSIGTSNDRY